MPKHFLSITAWIINWLAASDLHFFFQFVTKGEEPGGDQQRGGQGFFAQDQADHSSMCIDHKMATAVYLM